MTSCKLQVGMLLAAQLSVSVASLLAGTLLANTLYYLHTIQAVYTGVRPCVL